MRIVDLHSNWALQYAGASRPYDPGLYAEIPARLGRLDGYLMGTKACLLYCARGASDWAGRDDPWGTLFEMLAGYEAEFAGRLLQVPADLDRWDAEPGEALCWGMLGVEGFDVLVSETASLDRLPVLFERGVRAFQLIATGQGRLGGSREPGDGRGLGELGGRFLDRLLDMAPAPSEARPRPVVDVAGMNDATIGGVLDWFETEPARSQRVLLLHSRCATRGLKLSENEPSLRCLARMRALGGVIGLGIGPPHTGSLEELTQGIHALAALPYRERTGYEGLGIAADFLRLDETLPGLGDVAGLAERLAGTFPAEAAASLAASAGISLIRRAAGGS